jgi:NADH dehydrogenase (ubiquinone) Fe-S protein 6
MELINEVPPIKVDGRIAVCEGGRQQNWTMQNLLIHTMLIRMIRWSILCKSDIPLHMCCFVSASEGVGLGHPIEYICLDLEAPNVCKYCGLRYVQVHHH